VRLGGVRVEMGQSQTPLILGRGNRTEAR
jgi:hypothetical protein